MTVWRQKDPMKTFYDTIAKARDSVANGPFTDPIDAVTKAAGRDKYLRDNLITLLSTYIHTETSPITIVENWNDDATHEDVVALFDKVIADLDY